MEYTFAINGFGRIGRTLLRALAHQHLTGEQRWRCAGINTPLKDPEALAHLLRYDTVHGRFPGVIETDDQALIIDGQRIVLTQHPTPAECQWDHIDVVFECSGFFTQGDLARGHLQSDAKKVLISAPAKDVDATIVYGVNHTSIQADHTCISNASCTTNCLAPLVAPIHQAYGIASGIMTTIHAVTGDQAIIDKLHKDPRRGRMAYRSMIPTSTGAASAISQVIPELEGKLSGTAIRVPTDNVSLVDLTLTLEQNTSLDEVHALLKKASTGALQNVLAINEDPLVSVDFNQHSASSIVDFTQSKQMGNMIQLFAWYDNEWGFACRMLDTATAMMSA